MKLPSEDFDDSRARRLYPPRDGIYRHWFCDYQPIVESFGDVLVQVDDNDYSGDTRVLLKSGGRFGFLNFGWGSCSGCDALQSCNSYRAVEELIQGLERDIKWFDNLQDAKDYIASPDRKSSYYWHESEWKSFVDQVLALET